MADDSVSERVFRKIHKELLDSFDEELEMEIEDDDDERSDRSQYFRDRPPARSSCSTAAGTTARVSSASWGSAATPSSRSSSGRCPSSRRCWSGIVLVKYWFSITDEEQYLRFQMRIHDRLKQWKLSPMDLESRRRWEDYTRANEEMLERTHITEAPWWIVDAVDKKRARLNCIHHLLSQIPYRDILRPPVLLPTRDHSQEFSRSAVTTAIYVPEVF